MHSTLLASFDLCTLALLPDKIESLKNKFYEFKRAQRCSAILISSFLINILCIVRRILWGNKNGTIFLGGLCEKCERLVYEIKVIIKMKMASIAPKMLMKIEQYFMYSGTPRRQCATTPSSHLNSPSQSRAFVCAALAEGNNKKREKNSLLKMPLRQ